MRHKIITRFVLLLFGCLIPAIGYSTDVFFSLPDSLREMNFWSKGQFIGSKTNAYCPPLQSFQVIPQSAIADSLDIYQIKITLPPGGLPNSGGMAFGFPAGFDLKAISRIEYSDDYDSLNPEIRAIYVFGSTFVFRFKKGEMPPAGTIATFTIYSIRNSKIAGDYQAAGLIFDRHFRVISGPTLSEKFSIKADYPYAIHMIPYEPIFIRAGQSQIFTASVTDKFGNIIINPEVVWSLDPELDNIGMINNGNFAALNVGQGQVIARYADLTAYSDILTVMPGEFDHFTMTGYPNSAMAGEPFLSAITVTAFDGFGNIKYDYVGSSYFKSSDPGAILKYDLSKPYIFSLSDSGRHDFAGENFTLITAGTQNITITDGVKETTSGPIEVIGGHAAAFDFSLQYEEPARVGEPIVFQIFSAVDRLGNAANGVFHISLAGGGVSPGGDAPVLSDINVINGEGQATQYIYLADTIAIQAVSDSLRGETTIYLLPGEPDTITANIQPTQFVGNRLYGPATLTIYDQYKNLKFDFNASEYPISISTDKGELSRILLDNPNDFNNGMADLSQAGIVYNGEAGQVLLTFAIDSERKATLELIYNGIDFALSRPLPDSIFAGQQFSIRVTAVNNGDLAPTISINFETNFTSCLDKCLRIFHWHSIEPGQSLGFGGPISGDLLVPNTVDTLQLKVISQYLFNGDTISVSRMQSYPINIREMLQIAYMSNSLSIDTIISPSRVPSISLKLTSSIDLTDQDYHANAALFFERGDGIYEYLSPAETESNIIGNTIEIILMDVAVPDYNTSGKYQEGLKPLLARFILYNANGRIMEDSLLNFDSVMVLFPGGVSYIGNSLNPKTVMAGSENIFGFDISLAGNVPIVLSSVDSYLQLVNDNTVLNVGFANASNQLVPGNNHFKTAKVYITGELAGKTLAPRLILKGTELYSSRTDSIVSADSISVINASQIKITSTELITVNPPYVNYGQNYSIKVHLENLSNSDIADVSINITNEDGQTIVVSSEKFAVPAGGGIDVQIPMTADSVSAPAKIYKAFAVSSNAEMLTPDDNTVAVSIQSPAEIEIVYDLNSSYEGYLNFGQPFSIDVWLKNNGEATASSGTVTLSTNGIDFGVPDPSTMNLPIDSMGRWSLIAPSIAGEAVLRLIISKFPLDKNTGLPADVKVGAAGILLIIEPSDAELIVNGVIKQSALIIEGTARDLFALELKNNTDNSLNIIGLKYIDIGIVDRQDKSISPTILLDPLMSGFYESDSSILTPSEIIQNALRLRFADFKLEPKETKTIVFRAKFKENIDLSGFSIKIENNDISAVFVSGPRMNQTVPVRGKYDNNFRIGGNFIITPISTGQSLMVRNNPFNPNLGKAEIAYNLESDASVTMKIFTLMGEMVYQAEFAAGAEGGREGSNYLNWDGANEEGKTVVNGVYVVVIRNNNSGQAYKIKLAVLK
jgi:hypothetical protein